LRNEDLNVYGNGTQTRDFIFIKDIILANLLAIRNDVPGEVFNIGTGKPISLNNLAGLMLKNSGKNNLKIIHKPPREGDIEHSYTDISKDNEYLTFSPKYDQKKGLRDYILWAKRKNKSNVDNNIYRKT
jgi:nucleoside-diphosphate-sugar epimerase